HGIADVHTAACVGVSSDVEATLNRPREKRPNTESYEKDGDPLPAHGQIPPVIGRLWIASPCGESPWAFVLFAVLHAKREALSEVKSRERRTFWHDGVLLH